MQCLHKGLRATPARMWHNACIAAARAESAGSAGSAGVRDVVQIHWCGVRYVLDMARLAAFAANKEKTLVNRSVFA